MKSSARSSSTAKSASRVTLKRRDSRDRPAGEEPRPEVGDDVLDEGHARRGAVGGHADEAVEVGRHLHDRGQPDSPSRDRRKAACSRREPAVGKPGRPSSPLSPTRSGVSSGKTRSEKKSSSQRRSGPVQPEGLATASPSRARAGRISARHSYCRAMISRERRDTAASCSAGLIPEPSGVASPARSLGLERGYPDHEELVEIGRDNRQEFHPLEEGIRSVEGLLEDPRVELEPREFAVEVIILFCHSSTLFQLSNSQLSTGSSPKTSSNMSPFSARERRSRERSVPAGARMTKRSSRRSKAASRRR